MCCGQLSAQYYYRGEIVDDKGKLVTNTNVYIHSTKTQVSAGSSGSFGIATPKNKVDTFSIITDNYERISMPVFVDRYNIIRIKMLANVANVKRNKLTTAIKDFNMDHKGYRGIGGETYSELVENEFVDADKYPTTGFAIHSDKASYTNIRRFINSNSTVPQNAVRIDEMVNYFNLNNNHPNDSAVFNVSSQLTQCPWNTGNFLLYLNVTAKKIDLTKVPPSNLVFLIDNSGSMELQNRMPLLKSAFKLLIRNLRPIDKITIITYGGSVDVLAEALDGTFSDSLLRVIERMEPAGDTPGENAIITAYQKAKQYFVADGNNRIILATDGDFNVGISDEKDLENLITNNSKAGIYLTCLGVGMGNYKDSKLEVMAKKGKGNFAYLDSEQEAENVLVKEMTQTLYSVADDVSMNMTFNNSLVKNYRLLGYDNKSNAIADTSSKLEGGQIGSGYSTIVMFEISATDLFNIDSLEHVLDQEIGVFQINYKSPETKQEGVVNEVCKNNFKPILSLQSKYGFSAAVAMFGSYLKDSKYINLKKIEEIKSLALKTFNKNEPAQLEFITILEKAETLYEPNSKKKKRKSSSEVRNR